MEYQLLDAIIHGQRLNEPLTWVYIAAIIAVSIAGWKFGGLAFDAYHKTNGEEQ
ncbi:hypothetical protein M3A49_35185 [Paraburkholderia sp. CNPSo 3076]|uniref:hypothetical protein n=1 Tax=unclassified Paraburkholderia TaxID=2615204 RepID=UPI00225810C4|nr:MULTISPECIES: hypothetical protein [unclassified Paraburkholderia]MCX5544650.1 hypothetical protein [Paraburkholderia sp. CNPSo 3076]HKR45637.1 hypothetical protein [Paraburkholderia sp.]